MFYYAPAAGGDSCVDHCGGFAGSCWCDSYCTGYGDCCADFVGTCPEIADDGTGDKADGGSCAGNCGGGAGTCWCDSYCSMYGDCCDDCYY